MPNKIALELSPSQIEMLVEKLPIEEKIKLVRRLERETWVNMLDITVKKIRRHIKEVKISSQDIDRLCEEVKREYDEKHRRY